jgi:hypothetical protein
MKKIYMLFFVTLNIGVTFSQVYSLIDSMPIITSDPGLTRSVITGTKNWDIVNQSVILGTNGTNMYLLADGRMTGFNASFETNVVRNFSGKNNAFLRFPIGMGYSDSSNFIFKIEYSEDRNNWKLLKQYTSSVNEIIVNLDSIIGKTQVYFKFTLNAPNPANNNFIYIDYIRWVHLLNQFDANLLSANTSLQYQKINQNIEVVALVRNDGATKINSIEASYKLEGEATPRTQLFNNLNIEAFETAKLTFNQKITSNTSKKYKVSDFKLIKINNLLVDSNLLNNNLLYETDVIFLSKIPKKRVLFEQYTTAPCVHCPDGHVVADRMLANNPNVIAINIHAGFGTDQMTTQQATILAGRFAQGAPTAMIDRTFYSGEGYAVSRNTWESRALARSQQITPVSLYGKSSYNHATKKLKLNINIDIYKYLKVNSLRANAYIVQDSMTGVGTGWDQTNAYNNVSGHPMQGRGNPIVGYVHKRVMRNLIAGTWGENGKIKNQDIVTDSLESFTYEFDGITTDITNPNNAYLVVFVSDSGAMGTNNYIVHNSLKMNLNDTLLPSLTIYDTCYYSYIINKTICQGQSYLGRSISGTYIDTLIGANSSGCDSIRTLNLTVGSFNTFTINQSICQGQSFLGRSISGTYVDTLKNANSNGCDSIRTLILTVIDKPFISGVISGPTTVCQGQSNISYSVIEASNNPTKYNWSLPNGFNGVSNTNKIPVNVLSNATSGILTVMSENTCGNSNILSLPVIVNPKPQKPIISNNGNSLISSSLNGNQWYDLNGVIAGANNTVYIGVPNNSYYVVVTEQGCSSDPSNIISLAGSSITNDEKYQLFVFPVPFEDDLNIIASDNEEKEYRLATIEGKVLLSGRFKKNYIVSTKSISKGTYIVTIISKDKREHFKVVKN